MGRQIVTSLTMGAAVANGICLVQTDAAGLPLTLNGSLVNSSGVATMDVARVISIQSSGNDSGITFTINGTPKAAEAGPTISETISGANAGTVSTTRNFLTVTSIVPSGPVAGTVTIGTANIASGPWVVWNNNATDFNVGIAGYVLSGTPTWQVDYTYDDVFGLWNTAGLLVKTFTLSTMQGLTGTADGRISGTSVRASRLTLTAPGGVQLTQMQQGVV